MGWKTFSGIDCSALVQVFLNYNNRFCPRDTADQIKFFKIDIPQSCLVAFRMNNLTGIFIFLFIFSFTTLWRKALSHTCWTT